MKRLVGLFSAAVVGGTLLAAPAANAVPVALTSAIQCSQGNANLITVTDVTGNAGGATDCWGAFTGNDPGPSGDGFDINGTIFEFVAKQNTPGALEGADIGLTVSPSGGATSGTWAYDPSKFSATAFLIVLKAANSPGYGVWLFDGNDAASWSGDWTVAWGKDLSHLAIYATDISQIPLPAALPLFLAALGGLGLVGRRRRKMAAA